LREVDVAGAERYIIIFRDGPGAIPGLERGKDHRSSPMEKKESVARNDDIDARYRSEVNIGCA